MRRLYKLAIAAGFALASFSSAASASEFTDALAKEYFDLAQVEYYYSDDKYAVKARAADAGQNVMPEDPNTMKVPANVRQDLIDAHSRLVAALNGGFRESNPKQAARAQAQFDCWVWSVIESKGKDWRCVVDCREAFQKAIAAWTPPPAPRAEPVPAPVPEPQTFVTFFGFDQSVVTPQARTVIDQAVAKAKQGNVTRIRVVGHADRSGPAGYNMGLSQRRANAVKAEMVSQGIDPANITTTAQGETEPLVPTGDGVREPRNRRVEILY